MEAFFLSGTAGRIFGLFFPPVGVTRGGILYVPPFAEELNRCRVMVARQARALSEQGYGCLLLDLFGTGDSEGDFSDAEWEIWRKDVRTGAEWLAERVGGPVTFWGLRLGALLAADVASDHPNLARNLLFWQPVVDGKVMMTQFLRLRVASLMAQGLPAETTAEMRVRWKEGESVEVSGYRVSPGLGLEVDQKRLKDLKGVPVGKSIWLEAATGQEQSVSPASKRVIEEWLVRERHMVVGTFKGSAFWQLHERAEAPELIDRTASLLVEGA